MTRFLRLAASGPAYGLRLIMRPLFASPAQSTVRETQDSNRAANAALDRVEL